MTNKIIFYNQNMSDYKMSYYKMSDYKNEDEYEYEYEYEEEEEDEYADMPELIDADMPALIVIEYDYQDDYDMPDLIENQDYSNMPKLIHADRIGFDTDYEDE